MKEWPSTDKIQRRPPTFFPKEGLTTPHQEQFHQDPAPRPTAHSPQSTELPSLKRIPPATTTADGRVTMTNALSPFAILLFKDLNKFVSFLKNTRSLCTNYIVYLGQLITCHVI
ncbi:hypothetical protein CDAR_520441 [Caerostris darwini]|uniref:Uncharacterized protein n=1 Tax=Caerostris darwini TaxID=1538125 RepID=A0AAV4WAN0_9ARAC|nr:hypothetical protein CDAR_520441 [Caerostris darwini]